MSSANLISTAHAPSDAGSSELSGVDGFVVLLLLLGLPTMILVFFSMKLRARWIMEEEIRNETSQTVKFRVKPKLFDVYTTEHRTPGRTLLDESPLAWENLKPLSATLRKPVSPSLQDLLSQPVLPHSHTVPLETLRPLRDPVLTISIIINMPTPSLANTYDSPKDTFPSVEIGVTHLPVPHGWIMDTKSGPNLP